MDNSSVIVEVGFVWEFQYVTQIKSWLKTGLPWFFRCKFHKNSVACGFQIAGKYFFQMTMLKQKEDMVAYCKLIIFHLVGIAWAQD